MHLATEQFFRKLEYKIRKFIMQQERIQNKEIYNAA